MPPIRILVVDDEPDLELLVRQRFRRRIRDGELDFSFAGDGEEALEKLASDEGIDIVLSDINMPRMDGLTLLKQVRDLERLLKVVIVSAYGDLGNIRTAMNRGAFDFVTKPIDFTDLEVTIEKTNRELEVLRRALRLQEQWAGLQRELDLASRIQLSALPRTFPPFPARDDVDLYATMIPAQEVGGDLYDFFLIDEHRLGFAVGDVSGKGIGAAMFMAITRTLLRATALQGMPPDECIRHVNRVLYPESMPQMYVTLFYGELDTRTGVVAYLNAGHLPPLIMRSHGAVEPLERTGGIGLCLKGEFSYRSRTVQLQPGDSILLYTDGVTESVSQDGEQFTMERLNQSLSRSGAHAPGEIIREVLHQLEAFVGGAGRTDDATLLAIQYRGELGSHAVHA